MEVTMNKSLVRTILFATITGAILVLPGSSIAFPSLNEITATDVAKAATIGLGAYATYKLAFFCYNQFNEYIENKIITEAADNIVLAVTSNYTLQKLPEEQREKAFRAKARLIGMRKRILNDLKQKLSDPANSFSSEHRKLLQEKITVADILFAAVDLVRIENPYEDEYETPTTMDAFIESKIINSIILTCKPKEECSTDELTQKQKIEARRAKIVQKAQAQITSIWAKKLISLAIVALILTQSI